MNKVFPVDCHKNHKKLFQKWSWKLVLVLLLSACCIYQAESLCIAVNDGDTFTLENGEIVRLTGIDAPELSEPGGDTAWEYLSLLIFNKKVTLVIGGKEKDNFERLLRYVYLGDVCVNEEMIKAGYAEARYLPENDPNREYYIQLEMEAETKNAGLWRYTIFQPRLNLNWEGGTPIDWRDAHKHYYQYVIVEGVITDSYNSGEVCFLRFHPERQYISAVIFALDFPLFPDQLENYYLGKKVQIIGIIREYRGNPEIIVKTPGQIKIIG